MTFMQTDAFAQNIWDEQYMIAHIHLGMHLTWIVRSHIPQPDSVADTVSRLFIKFCHLIENYNRYFIYFQPIMQPNFDQNKSSYRFCCDSMHLKVWNMHIFRFYIKCFRLEQWWSVYYPSSHSLFISSFKYRYGIGRVHGLLPQVALYHRWLVSLLPQSYSMLWIVNVPCY
jgi:hypothetical protein